MFDSKNDIIAARRGRHQSPSAPQKSAPSPQTPPSQAPVPHGPVFGPVALPAVPQPRAQEKRYESTYQELCVVLQGAGYTAISSKGAYLNAQRSIFLPGISSGVRLFNASSGEVVDLTAYTAKIWKFPHQTPGKGREVGHSELLRQIKRS